MVHRICLNREPLTLRRVRQFLGSKLFLNSFLTITKTEDANIAFSTAWKGLVLTKVGAV